MTTLQAPGRLVDVGGYRLHLVEMGAGKPGPTVVLEAGLGSFSIQWGWVQIGVAQFARVVSYDRAGYGWSDPGPAPRTVGQEAWELRTLLGRAGIPGPYVLVGHSLGAHVVRMFAARHPELVAAVVLLDPSHPDQLERFPPAMAKASKGSAAMMRLMPALSRLRVTGLLARATPLFNAIKLLPPVDQVPARHFMTTARHWRTTLAEWGALDESNAQVRDAAFPARTPLFVVSGSRVEAKQLPRTVTAEQVLDALQTMHREIAALSARGVHEVMPDAGHIEAGGATSRTAVSVIRVIREALEAAKR